MLYAILFLKLWSYVQVNMWCRLSVKSKNTPYGRMRRQSLSYTGLHGKYMNHIFFHTFSAYHSLRAIILSMSRTSSL